MNYAAGSVSDVGIRRKNNQDSFCYELAEYQGEKLAFLLICDGMGGYSQGEIASAEVVTTFDEWFLNRMPVLLKNGFSAENLREEWFSLVEQEHTRISAYAAANHLRMGTTLTAALFLAEQYYLVHVGDCRLYEIRRESVRQLTHDHTVVQREIDRGNLAPEDAELDSRQNILLQCLGAGQDVVPDFVVGTIRPGASYLMCSDGFRHKISTDEIRRMFQPGNNPDRKEIVRNLTAAIEMVKARGETDNITAGLLVVN